MPTKIQLKRGTSANFNLQNLSAGEPAFVTDTGKLYVGDGTKKILINPVDKPVGIKTTTAYTKVRVNEYGQVVEQSNLTAPDIPAIATSQVTGLGTSAVLNTGTGNGQIPTLDSTGKFPSSVIPVTSPPGINNIYAYYTGIDVNVGVNQVVPINTQTNSGTGLTINANGGVNVSVTGTYWISYHVSAAAALLKVGLSSTIGDTVYWTGSMSVSSTSAVTPYTAASATIIRTITGGENIYIKNVGLIPTVYVGTSCSLCVVRIA